MAGGRGERFWPQSRLKRPKHLLPIVGQSPMLAQTIERLAGFIPPAQVIILTNAEQREAVLETCPEVPADQVVGEPVGRDTAPAVALATLLVRRRNPNASFAMLPADAVIHDAENFRAVLGAAFETAEQSSALLTIGIRPDHPATGYGYLQRGPEVTRAGSRPIFEVKRFIEKPALATAEEYLASGEFYWNAGMFIWTAPAIAAELERCAPQLWQAVETMEAELEQGHSLEATLGTHYPTLDKISIDYAVMEKAHSVRMVESAFDWDDVGSWPAVARHYEPDPAGNTIRGEAEAIDSSGNIILAEEGHLIGLIGVDDLIVVHTTDATLICPRDRAQEVKRLFQQILERPDGRKWE